MNIAPGMRFYSTNASEDWKAAHTSGRRFQEEWLIEFAWLAKQDSAGVVYPFCKLCKKKIRNRKAAVVDLQPNNTVDHKRNENSVAAVGS